MGSLDRFSLQNFTVLRPVPPPGLAKENVVVWTGWCCKGDREVAREAVAKGQHIDLALLFLSTRKKISKEQTQEWFNQEVLLWVDELLSRKQIFKASHILNNIKSNPDEELSNIFRKTTDPQLREYVGNHLKSNNKLEEKLDLLWHMLELIMKNNILISKYKLEEESIKCLDSQREIWKNEISAKLFLRTHDILLISFLNAEVLWKQLVIYNDIKLLNIWINIQFGNSKKSYDTSENLLKVFRAFPISNQMINSLDNTSNTSIVVLTELSKFGLFNELDKNNFINILVRLNKSDRVLNLYEILSKNTSNVSVPEFLNLLHDYCIDNNLFDVLNMCMKNVKILPENNSKHLDIIKDFRILVSNNFEENVLTQNIFNTIKFLTNDINTYLNENPYLFLSIILFSQQNFLQILNDKKLIVHDIDFFDSLRSLLNNVKIINEVYIKKTSKICLNRITYYDLLEKHLNIDVKTLFSYQFDKSLSLPHFNFPSMVEKYGYSKKVNHLFYIKQCRPSIAAKTFILNQFKHYGSTNDAEKKIVSEKILHIAVLFLRDVKVTTSCICFLEIIGVSSEMLRVTIESANLLIEDGCQIGTVEVLFTNIDNELYTIQYMLEETLMKKINILDLNNGENFVKCMNMYELVYKFSVLYCLKLPEMFLKFCACKNLWLPFLILAQLKNYPVDQIKILLQSLKSPNLLEHLVHSVNHDLQIDEHNVLMGERDSRYSYLARIGVRKTIETQSGSDSMLSSITSYSSYGSAQSSSGSEFLEIDILNTKATLLQTLIRCHNSTDPPKAFLQACQLYRNPLLAVFATSYEPGSIITHWLTWLSVSAELHQQQTFTNFESIGVCSKSVADLLNEVIKKGFPKTLLQSLQIFVPDNPLIYFIEFINICLNKVFDSTILNVKLKKFKNELCKSRRNSVFVLEIDNEMTYLTNKVWLESTAIKLLINALGYNCCSLVEQKQFLEIICKLEINNFFATACPNFQRTLDIINKVLESKSEITCNIAQILEPTSRRKSVLDCINKLINDKQFNIALCIAKTEELPLDLISIKECQSRFENREIESIDFWNDSNNIFIENNVTADCVIDFYMGNLEYIQNPLEKYHVTKLAYEWARNFELVNEYELEKQMWLSYMNLDEKLKNFNDLNVVKHNFLYSEMLENLVKVPTYDVQFSKENLQQLDKIMAETLNRSNFWLALKLEKMFGCTTPEMDVLKLCFNLAESLLLPYQLNTKQRLLLSTKGATLRRLSHRRPFVSTKFSGYSSASHSPANSYVPQSDLNEAPPQDTLAVLQSLSEKITNGSEMAYNIFMTYRISINIEIPYQVIVSNFDYMKMLKDALEDDCMNKLEVVHDFIHIYKWSKEEIADFICEEVINAASHYVRSKIDVFTIWDLNVDKDFNSVLQLLQENCSLLGYKIYSYASTLHKTQITANLDVKVSELALVIELLIASHACFTADCNMEGISIILKKCQSIISNLLTLRSWKLIVRLLTGVGRYSEMNYVFQILRENNQFEFLLRKGSKKDSALKVALLEYLKKYCPDNKELYKMVALHFTLFSEVAMLWEREAQNAIRNLIAISKLEMQNNKLNPDLQPFVLLSNESGTKMCLNKAIENYTYATEFHLQGEKLARAMNSAKQAELLALQLSLLKPVSNNGTANCILNLTSAQITVLTIHELSFPQTQILVQAYNFQADWPSILFEQCIVRNNCSYLDSYMNQLPLSENIAYDISRKFLTANIDTPNEIASMKNILVKLHSVHAKWRIASELGFKDLVEDLIAGGQLAYLKDTVWKKGYKN